MPRSHRERGFFLGRDLTSPPLLNRGGGSRLCCPNLGQFCPRGLSEGVALSLHYRLCPLSGRFLPRLGRAFVRGPFSSGPGPQLAGYLRMPFRCANGQYSHNEEPSIDEILAEPIVRMLMARDGVDETDLRRLVRELVSRGRLTRRS